MSAGFFTVLRQISDDAVDSGIMKEWCSGPDYLNLLTDVADTCAQHLLLYGIQYRSMSSQPGVTEEQYFAHCLPVMKCLGSLLRQRSSEPTALKKLVESTMQMNHFAFAAEPGDTGYFPVLMLKAIHESVEPDVDLRILEIGRRLFTDAGALVRRLQAAAKDGKLSPSELIRPFHPIVLKLY